MCFNFLSDEFLKCVLVFVNRNKKVGANRHRFGIDPVVTFDPTRSWESIRVPFHKNKGDMG